MQPFQIFYLLGFPCHFGTLFCIKCNLHAVVSVVLKFFEQMHLLLGRVTLVVKGLNLGQGRLPFAKPGMEFFLIL